MAISLHQWISFSLLVVIFSIFGLVLLWKYGGRELVNDIRSVSIKELAVRWSCFKQGQRRFIWLAGVLFAPFSAIIGFMPAWIYSFVMGISINLYEAYSWVFVSHLVLLHIFIVYLYITSWKIKNGKNNA